MDSIVLQLILSGISTGSLYALVGLGLIMIFKATDVLNFAIGEQMMVSAFFAWMLSTMYKIPYYQVFILTIIFSGFLGAVLQTVAIRPVSRAPVFSIIVLTFAVGMMLKGVAGMVWTFDTVRMPPPVSMKALKILGLITTPLQMLNLLIVTLLIVSLFVFFKFTTLGTAMRAAAQDHIAARLMGISTQHVTLIIWITSSITVGVAGMLFAPLIYVDVYMGWLAIKAFAATVLGGFGSVPGCIVGGILLGIIENMSALWFPSAVKDAIGFLIIILVLCVKPTGILGTLQAKRI
jgi:branched-chain amino acid transport system permease protein